MKYSSTNVASTPEILKRKSGGEKARPITVHSTALVSGVCKAGTPLDKDGKVANTASAVGILWNDVYDVNPNGSILFGDAVINKAVAQSHSGVTLSSDALGALSGLYFE